MLHGASTGPHAHSCLHSCSSGRASSSASCAGSDFVPLISPALTCVDRSGAHVHVTVSAPRGPSSALALQRAKQIMDVYAMLVPASAARIRLCCTRAKFCCSYQVLLHCMTSLSRAGRHGPHTGRASPRDPDAGEQLLVHPSIALFCATYMFINMSRASFKRHPLLRALQNRKYISFLSCFVFRVRCDAPPV